MVYNFKNSEKQFGILNGSWNLVASFLFKKKRWYFIRSSSLKILLRVDWTDLSYSSFVFIVHESNYGWVLKVKLMAGWNIMCN